MTRLARLLGPPQANEPPANQSVPLPTPSRSAMSRGRLASSARYVATALPFVLVALIPGMLANFALNRAGPVREMIYERWPNEPEVHKRLAKLRQAVGEPQLVPSSLVRSNRIVLRTSPMRKVAKRATQIIPIA